MACDCQSTKPGDLCTLHASLPSDAESVLFLATPRGVFCILVWTVSFSTSPEHRKGTADLSHFSPVVSCLIVRWATSNLIYVYKFYSYSFLKKKIWLVVVHRRPFDQGENSPPLLIRCHCDMGHQQLLIVQTTPIIFFFFFF